MNDVTTIRVAAGQLPAHTLNEADKSLAAIERAVTAAADHKAQLLVLPECAYPAYVIGSVDDYRRANRLTTDEFLIQLARFARKSKMHIVSGYVEDVNTHLHNSAVLIDDQGQTCGVYRKSFLWANDNVWFKPGDHIPIFDTSLGKIGMVICADTRAPEIIAKQIIDGVQLIAMPTCWINVAMHAGGFENPQPEYLISSRAKEFGVPFVCANKFGAETPTVGYCGRSMVVDGQGRITQEAAGDTEVLIVDDIAMRHAEQDHDHDELWQSLIHWDQATRTAPTIQEQIRIAVWPGAPLSREEVESLDHSGIELLVTNGVEDESTASQSRTVIVLPRHIGAVKNSSIGKIGCLRGSEFVRFGHSRLMALGGAEIMCIFEAPDDLRLLRTRAVENRVFVLAVADALGAIISPSGEVLGYTSMPNDDGIEVEVDLRDAFNKQVAPDTDIWDQRRVSTYQH